ncbi:MAG: 30S ribosomal protein S1 [Actinomycetota bacterium]|nr:30S ribosomal protein S1 [Actinomycetota bacterium]
MLDENGVMIPDYDSTIKFFTEGDLITGTVVRVDNNEVLVDIGYKSEGVIPLKELSIKKDVVPSEILSVGDEVEAMVLTKEDSEGRLILSKKRAKYERTWDKITKAAKDEEKITGVVIEVVKGGLILDIGLRGFLPASLVEHGRVRDLTAYLGQELECKIIEMDRKRNNVVLSRKAILENSRQKDREELLAKLEKGQMVSGQVSSIVNFGAFVDLGGLDGLIHISELSWEHVNHPSEVVEIGDKVDVQVIDIDRERVRISLGLKQTTADPWQEKVVGLSKGDIVSGKVVKMLPFGVFVAFGDDLEGMIHISEISEAHVETPEEVLAIGQEVSAKVVDIDLKKRKISLSLKTAAPETEAKEEMAEAEAAPKEEVLSKVAEVEEESAPLAHKEEEAGQQDASPEEEAPSTILEDSHEMAKDAEEKKPLPGSLEEALKQMKEERGQKED